MKPNDTERQLAREWANKGPMQCEVNIDSCEDCLQGSFAAGLAHRRGEVEGLRAELVEAKHKADGWEMAHDAILAVATERKRERDEVQGHASGRDKGAADERARIVAALRARGSATSSGSNFAKAIESGKL